MLTVARILYVQNWKDVLIPIMEKWMEKLLEPSKIEKLTALIKKIELVLFLLGNF